jgi:chloramphenicol-sensitive protein RarD
MGKLAAIGCYVYWGLIVFYWTWLDKVESQEILMHRVVWTLVAMVVVIYFRGSLSEYLKAFRDWYIIKWHLVAASLLALNWYLFVYGVTNGRITDASLGYFLCPFATIFWGRVFEKETLNYLQLFAIILAAVGVGRLAFNLNDFPYIATGIALTWSSYSVVKKRSRLGIFSSLGMEMTLLAPFALIALFWFGRKGELVWGTLGAGYDWLIVSTGVATLIPLLLYSYAVRRVSLTTMGLLQYIMPTMALLIAVFAFGEPFGGVRLFAFSCIWIGLGIYGYDSLRKDPVQSRDSP